VSSIVDSWYKTNNIPHDRNSSVLALYHSFDTTTQLRRALTMLLKNLLAVATLATAAFGAPTSEKRQGGKLKWFGINESGAEFGDTVIPGLYGKHYTWYDLKTIDQFMAQGMNMFRLNFRKLA
jgi:aryl-phospho-beta-D-glucosidase BglC (GH1 family)